MYVMCDAKRVSMDTWQSPMRVDACVCGLWRCVRFNFYVSRVLRDRARFCARYGRAQWFQSVPRIIAWYARCLGVARTRSTVRYTVVSLCMSVSAARVYGGEIESIAGLKR